MRCFLHDLCWTFKCLIMKKYKTTKKHPELKKGIKLISDQTFPGKYCTKVSCITLSDAWFEDWLKKGWIKEIKEKVWAINKDNNWKLFKTDFTIAINVHCEYFKSKKKALEYVQTEAEEMFIGKKIKSTIHDDQKIITVDSLYIDDCRICVISGIDEYLVWRPGSGWIAEPIEEKQYPKTDKEIIEFAPEGFYFYDKRCRIEYLSDKSYYDDINSIPTKELAEAFLSLMKLIKFRNAWWKVDGWEPDWSNKLQEKLCLVNYADVVRIIQAFVVNKIFAFKTVDIAKDFLESFKEDIEKAKELL